MAIKRTFNGATLLDPGVYTKIIVENLAGFPLQPTGIVGIIGEAQGGEPRVLDILERTAIQDAKARYKSGPIADALDLLLTPSNDPRIVNGASKVVVYKVNNSSQSTLPLLNAGSDTIVSLSSKNYGSDENNLTALVSEGAVPDEDATLLGSIDGPFTLAGGETLVLEVNGTTYTYTETLGAGVHLTAALAADMNTPGNWAPSKPVIAVADVTSPLKIRITLDPVVVVGGELDYGYVQVDPVSTIDTIVGITGEDRGQKGSRIILFEKSGEEETTLELGGQEVLSIKYVGAGTSCLLDVKRVAGELKLTTVVAGVPADNLDIVLEDAEGKNKFTLSELVAQIDANVAYDASVLFLQDPARNANQLDYYDDLEVINVAGVLKRDVFDLVDQINTFSQFAVATRNDNFYRAIEPFASAQLFSGASDGPGVTNTDWADGFEAFKEERLNIVVSLISKDKGAVSIDSVNTLLANHVKDRWSTDGRSEKNGYVSKLGTKDELKDASRALNTAFVSITGQQARVLDRNSEFVWQDPWALGCLAAGMQAGSPVGEPITKKLVNVNDVRVLDGSWSPNKNKNEMIEAGILFTQPLDTGGHRWTVGNTTYGRDSNFVYNRISVVEAAGFVAFDLRFNLDLVFIGTKARTGTAEAIANFIRNRMSTYLEEEIIVGDNLNDGLGYKNLRVELQGNTAIVNVSVTPVQGVDFILPTIYLADIRQSA